MKNKKIVILGIVVMISLLIYFLFTNKGKPRNTTVPITNIESVNPKTLPVSLSNNVSSYTNVPVLTFPATVPHYSASSSRLVEQETERLVSLLNISAPIQTIAGSRGKYLSAQNSFGALLVSEKPLSFVYDAASISGKIITYDSSLVLATGIKQLEDLSVLQAPALPATEIYSYFSPVGSSPNQLKSASGATMVQVDIPLRLETFPLYVGDANTPAFSLRFDGDKKLIQIRGYILPTIKKEHNEIKIISYKDAVTRLQTNSGILSSLWLSDTGTSFLTGSTPKDIEISGAKLGYLYLSDRKDLVPVFIFSGKGFVSEEGRVVNTTTIVLATP